MRPSFFRRHALALSACLVAAGSAGVTRAIAQGGCPCALTKHVGAACTSNPGASSMSIRSTAVNNQGGVEYYLIDVFGSWKQIDCGPGNGANGCTAAVYGEATLVSDGSFLANYLGSENAGSCGSPCLLVANPALNLGNVPHSFWQFTAFPAQAFKTILYLCDGCTHGADCDNTNQITNQIQSSYTPGS